MAMRTVKAVPAGLVGALAFDWRSGMVVSDGATEAVFVTAGPTMVLTPPPTPGTGVTLTACDVALDAEVEAELLAELDEEADELEALEDAEELEELAEEDADDADDED